MEDEQSEQTVMMGEQTVILALVDERTKSMKITLDKIFDAVYGNGKPGLNAAVHDIEARLQTVEGFERGCPIARLEPQVTDLVKRHESEDKERQELIAERKEAARQARNFRYTALATLATLAADIILRAIK